MEKEADMRTSWVPRPGVSLRRGADRHQTRTGWLHGRHSFDTGIDPFGADTHHGVLVVSNHDTIAPGSGFETPSAPQHGDRDVGARWRAGPSGLSGPPREMHASLSPAESI
jgi:hypothetical protein